jgi:ABC-type transport system involved in multi-copper enzyme maturation permease subunit
VKALLALVGHSLHRWRWFLLAECVVLFLFQILLVEGARALEAAGGFSAFSLLLPQFLQEWAGVMMSSFRGLALLGYAHPVVLLLLVATAITIGTEVVEETETRFVDLVMARPLPRRTPVNRSILVLLIAVAATTASMLLGTWFGLAFLKPAEVAGPAWRLVASLAAGLALVVCAWGGIALAIATLSTRRATAGGVAALLAAASFILAILGGIWDGAAPFARISPFWYYDASEIIGGGGTPWGDFGVLAAITVAGCTVAHLVYGRRDL